MVKSYVEYILLDCDDSSVSRVSTRFKTKDEFLSSAMKGFNGKSNILGQGYLINSAVGLAGENGYLSSRNLGRDAEKVHLRCTNHLGKMYRENRACTDVDREQMFNVLTDVNWLLSSKYFHDHKNRNGLVTLLESPIMIRIWAKNALEDVLYRTALEAGERSKQYETAQLFRYQISPLFHRDPEVRAMLSQGYAPSDFKELQLKAHDESIEFMALFYGLTATAARAENIRRMVR